MHPPTLVARSTFMTAFYRIWVSRLALQKMPLCSGCDRTPMHGGRAEGRHRPSMHLSRLLRRTQGSMRKAKSLSE